MKLEWLERGLPEELARVCAPLQEKISALSRKKINLENRLENVSNSTDIAPESKTSLEEAYTAAIAAIDVSIKELAEQILAVQQKLKNLNPIIAQLHQQINGLNLTEQAVLDLNTNRALRLQAAMVVSVPQFRSPK